MLGYSSAGSSRKGAGAVPVIVLLLIVGLALGGYFLFKDKGQETESDTDHAGNGSSTTLVPADPDSTTGPVTKIDRTTTKPPAASDTPIPGSTEFSKEEYAAAAAKLKAFVAKNPKNARAFLMLGLCQLKLLKSDAAEKSLQQAMTLAPKSPAGTSAALNLGDSLYDRFFADVENQERTKWELTRQAYSVALRSMPYDAEHDRLVVRLRKLNDKLLWSKMLTRDTVAYQVMPGDNVERIAVSKKISRGCARSISRINRLKKDRISPGQSLKVIVGWKERTPFKMEMVVSKKAFKLTAYLNGYFFGEFPVAVGKAGATPKGDFVIDKKDKKPDWTETLPDGSTKTWDYGTEKNILGTRWMGFINRPEIGATSLGIHGTTQPDSIGTNASAGCIRMLNADVELLYDFTPERTIVRIIK
jgi:L,D-transpeptidase catalytic domain